MIYDAGITNASLITDIKAEADISVTIPDSVYIRHLNALYQFIYREYIVSEAGEEVPADESGAFTLADLTPAADEDDVVFDDIMHVYLVDDDYYELLKTTHTNSLTCGVPCYYRDNNDEIAIANVDADVSDYYVVRQPRPAFIETAADANNVPLPYEFVQLAVAKLLGEVYKVANDDVLSAKWLNEYNSILEDFKVWLSTRSA